MTEKKTTPIKKKLTKKKGLSHTQLESLKRLSTEQNLPLDTLSSCTHPNLVPIEVSFIRVTHPNGYKEPPKVEFYISISLATAFRVRKYYCPECKEIIKAPSIYAEEK